MTVRSWCEIESLRYLAAGESFTGKVDGTGYGVRKAEEPGYLITMKGGCECVFVSDEMLVGTKYASEIQRRSSAMVVGGAKKQPEKKR